MHIALAQLNQRVGDITGNAASIVAAAHEAQRAGTSMVVTPELSLCGYPPEDLLLRPAFIDACAAELAAMAPHAGDVPLLVGFPEKRDDGKCHNAYAVLRERRVDAIYRKQ